MGGFNELYNVQAKRSMAQVEDEQVAAKVAAKVAALGTAGTTFSIAPKPGQPTDDRVWTSAGIDNYYKRLSKRLFAYPSASEQHWKLDQGFLDRVTIHHEHIAVPAVPAPEEAADGGAGGGAGVTSVAERRAVIRL